MSGRSVDRPVPQWQATTVQPESNANSSFRGSASPMSKIGALCSWPVWTMTIIFKSAQRRKNPACFFSARSTPWVGGWIFSSLAPFAAQRSSSAMASARSGLIETQGIIRPG